VSKRGSLRASDADRDQVVDRLHKAATEGRIASEELEHRVSAALKARTYDELEETVTDLPSSRRGREPARASSAHWALTTVRANPMLLLFAIPVLAVTAALLVAATIMWSILMIAVLILGGRAGAPRPPWVYARRRGLRPRRGPGSYWA
jgi:Domain of unknown function (DUF1707)